MSSSAALRPGIALGLYPQREDLRDSWLDRTAASIAGFIRQQAFGRSPGHAEFLERVNAAARELGALTNQQIRDSVPELRRRLYSEGLTEELVARVFAIAREGAGRLLGMRRRILLPPSRSTERPDAPETEAVPPIRAAHAGVPTRKRAVPFRCE